MKNQEFENASQRKSYVGHVYSMGEKLQKDTVLNSLPTNWAQMHRNGEIHIHDLDAYGITYNCLTFNLLNSFPYSKLVTGSDYEKIIFIFDFLKEIIVKIGNEQSGGMSFANFDDDIGTIINNLKVDFNNENQLLIKSLIRSFILWCNNTHDRMGQVSYYVSLNFGLSLRTIGQRIAFYLLDEFENSGTDVIKPNLIFKVKSGINRNEQDPNFELYKKACLCTAKKMIPTYLLCDSVTNSKYEASEMAIMGCRTRVMQNEHGKETSIGRGNIDYITINLPRIALEIVSQNSYKIDDLIEQFLQKWRDKALIVREILLDRYKKLLSLSTADFPTNFLNNFWITNFRKSEKLENIFKNGTLSIGFIGLSETMEILTGEKFYKKNEIYSKSIYIVKKMREFVDELRHSYQLNFTLLATNGEYISGRFPKIDSTIYKHIIFEKGFYTNSFHVNVDSELSAKEKIRKEGIFHQFCNGGAITYVEIKSPPLGNYEGIQELIEEGINSGTSYLGFNFPVDICNECSETGIFDICTKCQSTNIKRIRRVSGYLEILDYFTDGKKAEVKNRIKNIN